MKITQHLLGFSHDFSSSLEEEYRLGLFHDFSSLSEDEEEEPRSHVIQLERKGLLPKLLRTLMKQGTTNMWNQWSPIGFVSTVDFLYTLPNLTIVFGNNFGCLVSHSYSWSKMQLMAASKSSENNKSHVYRWLTYQDSRLNRGISPPVQASVGLGRGQPGIVCHQTPWNQCTGFRDNDRWWVKELNPPPPAKCSGVLTAKKPQKLQCTAQTYNRSVNHWWLILSPTRGQCLCSLVHYWWSTFLCDILAREIWKALLGDGLWLIVDNGLVQFAMGDQQQCHLCLN